MAIIMLSGKIAGTAKQQSNRGITWGKGPFDSNNIIIIIRRTFLSRNTFLGGYLHIRKEPSDISIEWLFSEYPEVSLYNLLSLYLAFYIFHFQEEERFQIYPFSVISLFSFFPLGVFPFSGFLLFRFFLSLGLI